MYKEYHDKNGLLIRVYHLTHPHNGSAYCWERLTTGEKGFCNTLKEVDEACQLHDFGDIGQDERI